MMTGRWEWAVELCSTPRAYSHTISRSISLKLPNDTGSVGRRVKISELVTEFLTQSTPIGQGHECALGTESTFLFKSPQR